MVRIVLGLLLAVAATGLAACANDGNKTQMGINQYDEDGFMGQVEGNPNLQTSPTHHSYARDAQMAHRALQNVPGIRSDLVWMNGSTMYVHVRPNRALNASDREALRRQVHDALDRTVPKYYRLRVSITG